MRVYSKYLCICVVFDCSLIGSYESGVTHGYGFLCVLQTIQAQARSHSGELLSEAQLDLTVQVPVSMALDVRGGQLAVGREITIFPHGLGVCILSSLVSFSWLLL